MGTLAGKIMDSIQHGYEVKYIPDALATLYRPSIQPFMKSWMEYDPQQEIKKLNIPVLLLQGNTDKQVTVKDAENLKKANPKAKLVIVDQMNHVLKTAPEDMQENMATYNEPDLPLHPVFTVALINFIKY